MLVRLIFGAGLVCMLLGIAFGFAYPGCRTPPSQLPIPMTKTYQGPPDRFGRTRSTTVTWHGDQNFAAPICIVFGIGLVLAALFLKFSPQTSC
jgi:hypothetical protein